MSAPVITLLCLGWAVNVPYYFGTAFYQEQFLATVLGLALALAFNAVDWRGKPHAKFSPFDLALGLLGLGAALWTAVGWDYLLHGRFVSDAGSFDSERDHPGSGAGSAAPLHRLGPAQRRHRRSSFTPPLPT